MNNLFQSSLVRYGESKVIRGSNFLFPVNLWGEAFYCFRIDLETTVLRVDNESLNLKSPTPRGFYGYFLKRLNKTPVGDVVPISFRNQRNLLFDSFLATYPTLYFGFLGEILGGIPGVQGFLTETLQTNLQGFSPKPDWTNVIIKPYACTLRARLVYHLVKRPDVPFFENPSEQDFGGSPPTEEKNLPALSEIPEQITIENSSFGGDFSTGTPESLLGLKFQARDVVNGNPQPWIDLPNLWGVFDLPIIYEEPRENGMCFKQVRTKIQGIPLSPGGVVPCDTWQIELRVVQS